MRSLYKGIIGFGLVSIPIQVYKAMESERVTTHWIHEPCKTRIQYRKFCPTCGERQPDSVLGGTSGPEVDIQAGATSPAGTASEPEPPS